VFRSIRPSANICAISGSAYGPSSRPENFNKYDFTRSLCISVSGQRRFRRMERAGEPRHIGAVSPYRNYLSTMLLRPFKDLEWHKRKKHRRRRLSLLLRGLLATSQSRSSAIVLRAPFETRRLLPLCALLLSAPQM